MYQHFIRVAGVHFCLRAAQPLQLPEAFRPFAEAERTPDVTVEFLCGPAPYPPQGEQVAPQVFCSAAGITQCYAWQDQYIQRFEPADREDLCRLTLPKALFSQYIRGGNWLPALTLERPLLRHGRAMLHASAVIYEGKAYLFLAPSGGGKSTQAALWEKLGARLLNGDKVVVSRTAQGWTAWGSPIAGSSGIYRDLQAPAAAVMVVKKSEHDRLRRLSGRDSLLQLYGFAVKSGWDRAFNCRLLDLLEQMALEVPVYELECTPRPSAAVYALQKLKGTQL